MNNNSKYPELGRAAAQIAAFAKNHARYSKSAIISSAEIHLDVSKHVPILKKF